ncbi:MAG TPA: hypothetical protein VEL74_20715 [Thermoanaerobaculia bacterium]|nr:hypothetical protein [Thermoanaerobaculia bacterium]
MGRSALLVFLLACLSWADPATAGLQPEPFASGELSHWDGPQFVEADRAGHVYFLRADTLQVYPVTKEGTLGEPIRLKPGAKPIGEILNAAMSPDGEKWLLQSPFSIWLFADGKEKPVPPLTWKPESVGFHRDDPLVAVAPMPLGKRIDPDKIATPPWLLELGSDRWSVLRDLEGVSVAELLASGEKWNDAIAESSVLVAPGRLGHLWMAHQYAYRLQRLSPTGRSRLEITVGDGKVQHEGEKGPSQWSHGSGALKQKGSYQTWTAATAILDLAEGPDGRLYLLVPTESGGLALDRYDPVRLALERVSVKLSTEGRFTIAAGKDALYLAAWNGTKGRWRLPWEALEEAEWAPVENAAMDGIPMDAEGDSSKQTSKPADRKRPAAKPAVRASGSAARKVPTQE